MVQQQCLQIRVCVVLACLVMFVVRTLRRKFLQPFANIFNQTALVIVDLDSSRVVHRRDKTQSVPYPLRRTICCTSSVMGTICLRFLVSKTRYSV